MRAYEFINEDAPKKRWRKTGGLWFKGYKCTKDCSGHKAGYRWSKGKKINNVKNCPIGVNNSFREGCLSCAKGR